MGTYLALFLSMQLLYGLTLASLAFALALMVPVFLPTTEAPALGAARAQVAAAAPRTTLCGNMFDGSGSLCGPRQAAHDDEPTAEDEPVKCDALTLLGIVRDGDEVDRALFAGQGVVKRGEETDSGYSLIEVYPDRTVLARGDLRCEVTLFDGPDPEADTRRETVSSATSTPAASAVTPAADFPIRRGRVQVPRAVLNLASPTSLAGVSAIPTSNGIRLRGIAPASLPARLGLRSGDLIVELDGRPLTPDTALALATRLSELEHVTAQVRRGREIITLRADVVD